MTRGRRVKIKRYFLFHLEKDFLFLIDTVRLYSHIDIYIWTIYIYIVSTVSRSNVHIRFTGDQLHTGLIESLKKKTKKHFVVVVKFAVLISLPRCRGKEMNFSTRPPLLLQLARRSLANKRFFCLFFFSGDFFYFYFHSLTSHEYK